jgi:hypothetical protein
MLGEKRVLVVWDAGEATRRSKIFILMMNRTILPMPGV